MPPSTAEQGSKTTQTQRRRAAKEAKGSKGIKSIEEATSKLTINDEQGIRGHNEIYPKQSDVSSDQWKHIMAEHNIRTKAERRLFESTKLLPHKCRIDADPGRMLEFNRLFGQKAPLLENPHERYNDDVARRNAIADLMKAREAAGFEPFNEAGKWTDLGLDITKELKAKLTSKYFVELQERCADRQAHNQFMEDNLKIIEHDAGAHISEFRKNWLRSKTNKLVCSPNDTKGTEELQRTSIQVIYWIIVRRAEAGIPLELTHSSPSTQTIAMHEWLITRPLSFFEDDDFQLDTYFDIELEQIKNLTRREKEEHSKSESNDGSITPESMEAAEFDPEMVAKMDAELEAISSGDEQPAETSRTTAVYAHVSAHNRQHPISRHVMLTHEGNYDNAFITQEPIRARKRQRSSSPQFMVTDEDDYDNDFMYPEPDRTPKRRR